MPPMADEASAKSSDSSGRPRSVVSELLRPVPLTIFLILLSVFVLIAADITGYDNGRVLARMAEHEFARGLITYLFAVTTIGTSVVLVMAALTGALDEDHYKRGKEILALLLGVFGTIVGFYFGSEAHAGQPPQLNLSPPVLASAALLGGASTQLTAYVNGGDGPYMYGYTFGNASTLTYERPVDPNGWIQTDIVAPAVQTTTAVHLLLGVQDSSGKTATRAVVITVRPPTEGR